jgi:hypothetical protein
MLAMMPTVWIDWMYRTGASGIGLSLASLVATAFYAHRYVYVLTRSHAGGLVAAAAVLLSLNFLFLGASPMSEVPFAALSLAGWYYLVLWAKAGRQQNLAIAALLIAASTMIRYDGWFSLVTGALFIVLANPARRGRESGDWTLRAEAELTAFGAIVVFPIFLWILYNAIIFGHPFAFATGAGSAADFARQFATASGFSARGDVIDSVRLFGWTVLDNVGGLVAVAALVGFVVAAAVFRNSVYAVALLLPASVIAFNIVSLYVGGSVMVNPHLTPELDLYNVRYGVMAVPFVAILVGTLASFGRALLIVVVIVIASQTVIFARGDPVATVREVRQGDFELFQRTAAAFNETYDHGLVLIAYRDHASMMTEVKVPLRTFIHEGVNIVEPSYSSTIERPARYVRYVVIRENGLGDLDDRLPPSRLSDFEVVARTNQTIIYRVKPEAEKRERALQEAEERLRERAP